MLFVFQNNTAMECTRFTWIHIRNLATGSQEKRTHETGTAKKLERALSIRRLQLGPCQKMLLQINVFLG